MSGPFPQMPVKRVATVTLGKMLQSSASSSDDVLMPYLRAAHIQPGGRILELDEQPMWFSRSELRSLQLSSEDVVVVEGGAGYGRSAHIRQDRPGWGFQNSILRVRRNPELSVGAFIYYAFQAALDSGQIAVVCNTATFAHFTAEKVAALEIPAPSLARQRAVVSFLDQETAEIDAFIADQEELIGLLAERRAATISHAVTKGLDPTVPMKDSGVERIGEIPADWRVWPFTRLAPGRVDYRGATPTKVDEGILLVTARNVRQGYLDYETSREFVAPKDYTEIMRRGEPRIGDILLTMEAPLGNVALVDRTDIALAQRLVKFRVTAEADAQFVQFALMSSYFQHQLQSRATGSTALGIKASKLAELRIALPDRQEQEFIAARISAETQEFDVMITDAMEAIALSRERRAALISAAVTGKIDVREHGAVA